VRSRGSGVRSLSRCADCWFCCRRPHPRRDPGRCQTNDGGTRSSLGRQSSRRFIWITLPVEGSLKECREGGLSFARRPSIGHANPLNTAAERFRNSRFQPYDHDTDLCCYKLTGSSSKFGKGESEECGTWSCWGTIFCFTSVVCPLSITICLSSVFLGHYPPSTSV